jgi:hypothetical protein
MLIMNAAGASNPDHEPVRELSAAGDQHLGA